MFDRDAIEKEAFEEFKSGFCCAESVLMTTLRRYAPDAPPEVRKLATGFIGGIGKSKDDVCGALVGGVMALGYLYGRTELSDDIEPLLGVTTEFRTAFIKHCGHTSCPKLLEAFGEQEDMLTCKKMAAEVTGLLAEIIEEKHR